jgi:hypothetical protein
MAEDARKTELIAELAHTRAQISESVHHLGHDLDFRTRARRAFARHPAIWIGIALLLGLFVSRLPFRRKKAAAAPRRKKDVEPVVEKAGIAGLALAGLKMAFDLARPALTAWVTRRVTEHFDPSRNPEYTRR